MKYNILPSHGVDGIVFGTKRAEVRRSIGKPHVPCGRDPNDDFFPGLGIFAYYNLNDELIALEFAAPANPVLKGTGFIGQPFAQARAFLDSAGGRLTDDEAGATALNLGVGLFASGAKKDPMQPVEAVIVFAPGYYD